jgi:hypothetical protein
VDDDPSAGPLAGAAWEAFGGDDGVGVIAVPDAANAERAAAGLPDLYHGLPDAPRLARDPGGKPLLSLSLVLHRRPAPGDDSVFELVESASLACDLTLALPDGAQEAAHAIVRPLYARDAELTLEREPVETLIAEPPLLPPPPPLAQVHGSGAGWRAGLAAQLDRSAAQGVLAALDGQASGLLLRCRIGYRATGRREQLRLTIRWRAVRDLLAAHVDAGASFSGASLRALLPALVEAAALRAWRVEGREPDIPVAPDEAADLWPAFSMLSSAVLERLTPALAPSDPQARFALRDGFIQTGEMTTDWTLGSARDGATELVARLETVLQGALDGQHAEDFLHLVCPDAAAPGGYVPVPPRRRVSPPRAAPGMPPAAMALVGNDLLSMTRALQPDRSKAAPPNAVLVSDKIQHHAGAAHAFAMHDLELAEDGVVAGVSVPRVDDPNGALWIDSVDAGRWWYAPEFELVQPNPAGDPAAGGPAAGGPAAGDPAASPFLFSYRQVGHDADGQPTLEGTVRCTLRRRPGAATAALLAERGNPPARPVVPLGLGATLSLPVRDAEGQLRRVDLAATVSDGGDTLTVDIALLAQYVRAAYGSLALAGFQSEPARLQVAYSFDALVPGNQFVLTLAYAGKVAQTPVATTVAQQAQLAGRAHLDAVQLAYRDARSDVQFKREAPLPRVPQPEPALALAGGDDGAVAPRPAPVTALAPGHAALVHADAATSVVAIHPTLENAALQQELLRRRRYVHQVQGRQPTLDVFFPCNTLGAFYCQQQGDTLAAIGCRESFSLGQLPFKLFEEVADPGLAGLPCKVFRSLSQPGRFVLLPASYLITRFGPAEGERAYRPAVYLYSSVDAEVPANNRCILMATLQPDLTPDQRHRIDAVLARLYGTPVADYITAIDCKVKGSDWLAGLAPEVARLWDGFQVTLSTDPAGALVLQEMLRHGGAAASVTFTLADGTELSSSLQLDLNRLTGPWDGGPVALALDGANGVLTNRIERPVDVSDLAVVDAGGAVSTLPAERQLKPGEAMTLALPAGSKPGWAVYAVPPGDAATLEEIRSFVEDVQTNVLFINIINYANHGLQRLDLLARLKEVPGSERPVTMNAEQTMGEAVFMLPLTVYQGPRTLQFQVTKTALDGATSVTGWLEADLRRGNAVTLSWDLIG